MSVGDKNNRCYLISYVSDQDTSGFEPDEQQEIRKKAWCKVESISGREFARMGQNNIRPSCRVTIWANEYSEQDTVELDGKKYLQVNGTKTANAVRRVPLLPETEFCYNQIQGGFRASLYKQSVIEAGKLCGFTEDFIEENHIVFHSFRKMYKTLLESCNITDTWIEYYMGHSQTSSVKQLYFVAEAADDSDIYPKVIEALKKLL